MCAHQRGLGWGTDYPYAEINLSIRLSELTKTRVSRTADEPNHFVVRPTDDALFQCPLVIMSDPGSAGFSSGDVERLQRYLLKGGFLWVDDYWGPWAWDDFARARSARCCRRTRIRFARSTSIIPSSRRCSR